MIGTVTGLMHCESREDRDMNIIHKTICAMLSAVASREIDAIDNRLNTLSGELYELMDTVQVRHGDPDHPDPEVTVIDNAISDLIDVKFDVLNPIVTHMSRLL